MRSALVVLAACGGVPSTPLTTAGSATPVAHVERAKAFEPIDLFTALASPENPDAATAFVAPVPLQLELGGSVYESTSVDMDRATLVDRAGTKVRVALRHGAMHFGAWVDDYGVLPAVVRDIGVAELAGGGSSDVGTTFEVALRPGARVRRLAHAKGWTQVRYDGELEVNGWLPDDALADVFVQPARHMRLPTGAPQLMLMPGAIFRTRPEWTGRELAILASGYLVDVIKELDDAWVEVAYTDTEVRMHAVVSKHAPPGRVHRPHEREPVVPIVPDATAPRGTCLYARAGGEPIGFFDADQPVQLVESGQLGWWTLRVDTPWDGLAFLVEGHARDALATCR